MIDGWQKHRWQYVALFAIFIPLGVYQARFVYEYLNEPGFRLRFPFSIRVANRTLASVAPAGRELGLETADRVVSVDGRPFVGLSQMARAGALAKSGDVIRMEFERDARRFSLTLPWVSVKTMVQRSSAEVLMGWMTAVLMPILSLAFAFLVGFLRPRDPMAWLFVALFIGFSQIGEWRGNTWEDGLRPLAIFMHNVMVGVWPASMLLLGVYFGFPFPIRAVRMAAVTFVGLLLSWSVLNAYYEVGVSENTAWTQWLTPIAPYLDNVAFWSAVSAIGCFFALMQSKRAVAKEPDVRRKLTLLLTGVYASLTPIFIYIMLREIGGVPDASMPLWFRLPVHLALLLFPVALAYVIVVHRAVDVRVVLRSGLRYTLARGGVHLLRMGLIIVAITLTIRTIEERSLRLAEQVALIGVCVVVVVLLRRFSTGLFEWLDRRFFREAYSSEHVLAELAEKVRTVVDPQQLFHIVADRISTALHVPQIAFFLANGERFEPAFALGGTPAATFHHDAGPIRRLRTEREPVQLFLDDQECWVYGREVSAEDRQRLTALNAQLLMPLEGSTGLVGFVALSRKRSEEPFSRGDMRLLRSVGLQTGLAIENSRLASSLAEETAQRECSNRELEIAREVQQRLFPQRVPQIPGIEIIGACRPALAVGGDYYDYFEFAGGNRAGFAVGDVSGKGVGAAIMMATVQASLRTQVLDDERNLAVSVSRLNQVVYEASTRNRFATLFYAQYDCVTGRLSYVNAGHNRPVIIRRDGAIERLSLTGIAIGLKRNFEFRQAEVTLGPGDLVVAFTDGISESMNAKREEWSEDELAITALELSSRPLPDLLAGILSAAERFAAGAPQHDDMTLVVLRVSPK